LDILSSFLSLVFSDAKNVTLLKLPLKGRREERTTERLLILLLKRIGVFSIDSFENGRKKQRPSNHFYVISTETIE